MVLIFLSRSSDSAIMLRNNALSLLTFFYPIGNTPPADLTRNLPPECDGDILLLGCGDVRNILFTIHLSSGTFSKVK
jgi:hypothetical protein